ASRTWPWRAARMHRSWPRRWRKRAACSRKRWHDATRPRRSRRGHGPRPGARMKALVLAGGRGTRLRPITHTSAKQLIPVANKPVLFYGLEAIRAAGITEVGIVVGDPAELLRPDHRTGEQVTVIVNSQAEIREAVGNGHEFGLRVTYLQQDAPLGLAHAVKISRDYM